MPDFSSGYIIGYHSCDRDVGLNLIDGSDELKASKNSWDWLGEGIYFWEEDPDRALQYAIETATGRQKNKKAIKIPFVVGAIIEPGRCLDLVKIESLQILEEAYLRLHRLMSVSGLSLLINKDNNRALDCAVINYIHEVNDRNSVRPYYTIRCAFPEGDEVFPASMITSRLHIQLCVRSAQAIKGYFLPRPMLKYNPNL